MPKFFFILLFFVNSAFAIEYEFDGGRMTALGAVTDQAAGLGFLDTKFRFAASASALEFTNFNIKGNSFDQNNSPMSFKPVFVGSAMSTSYGGWSFLVYNFENDYRASLDGIVSGNQTNSTISLNTKALSALVSAGLRIHENWSLGWGIVLSQSQVQSKNETHSISGAFETLAVNESLLQSTTARLNMGAIYSLEEFVLGLKVLTPTATLLKSGKSRIRSLTTTIDQYSDTIVNESIEEVDDWDFDVGLRFGRTGFAYILGDNYNTNGRHNLNAGFEYIGSWGSIASGVTYSDFQKSRETKVTAGFVKDHQNFKWGIGPYYETNDNTSPGAFNWKTFGVLYSSEIRY